MARGSHVGRGRWGHGRGAVWGVAGGRQQQRGKGEGKGVVGVVVGEGEGGAQQAEAGGNGGVLVHGGRVVEKKVRGKKHHACHMQEGRRRK